MRSSSWTKMEEAVGAHKSYQEKGPLPASEKNVRVFGIGAALILLAIWALRYFYLDRGSSAWLLGFAAYFLVSGVALQAALRPVYKVWIWIAHKIGAINAYVLLSVIFFFIVTPIGCLMRLFGKTPLPAMAAADGDSFWISREKAPERETYTREF